MIVNKENIMVEEHLSIAWKEFEINSSSLFKGLLDDKDFTDVKLATADKKQINAHKVILSFSSPLFKEILVSNPHQCPLIYLKGIRYTELESIIRFVYMGQCEVKRDNLEDFLKAAKELQIIGLNDDSSRNVVKPHKDSAIDISNNKEPHLDTTVNNKEPFLDTIVKSEPVIIPEVPMEIACRDMRRRGENVMVTRYEGKVGNNELVNDTNMNNEVATRIEIPNNRNENGKYPCDQCDYEATVMGSLKSHVLAKHTSIRFDCDQCDYRATQRGSLKRHKASIHEGVKYFCDQCDYVALTAFTLKSHKESKHEGVKYDCGMCEYKATQRSSLRRHQKNIHGVILSTEHIEDYQLEIS